MLNNRVRTVAGCGVGGLAGVPVGSQPACRFATATRGDATNSSPGAPLPEPPFIHPLWFGCCSSVGGLWRLSGRSARPPPAVGVHIRARLSRLPFLGAPSTGRRPPCSVVPCRRKGDRSLCSRWLLAARVSAKCVFARRTKARGGFAVARRAPGLGAPGGQEHMHAHIRTGCWRRRRLPSGRGARARAI